ncbi:type II toxin-antitoxin system RelE/ParE family toxin [Halioxenophilus aromaticivorans]|uniref:type II toxin-antitoxin system RelE family toxin n=1 Tax=Halioxenophilus aromaticivorans TaxID=1306992 RepID=UPI0036F291F1
MKEQFKKKLMERLQTPHVRWFALSGANDCCKIKLPQAGCRLVYFVDISTVTIVVIAVGKGNRMKLMT